ncbi:MAG: SGNH/GDSL hydrolase family protein [Candidatus Daviesbacteria bacterium]|nr:SGNH/GDSL hydrolase family protein [Candidatus Daviesbacteria bacterium]
MKKFLILLSLILIITIPFFLLTNLIFKNLEKKVGQKVEKKPLINVREGNRTKVKYPDDFTIVLVGDSMTERLGNSDEIRANLKEYYPDKSVEVLNYGFGSTNILSVEERLTEKTFYNREFRPILDIAFDILILESFGNNPLSELSLEDGIKKQTEALDRIVELIKEGNPRAKLIFMATIAPNRSEFGKGVLDLSDKEREKWVKERVSYIQNHIDYAKSHNIPLANAYEESLTKDGTGKEEYLSKDDFIHPSPKGVIFISKQIADFLYESKILEK